MNIDLTSEQLLLQQTVTRLFRENSTSERVRHNESTGFDPLLWQQLVELGVPGARLDAEKGGLGLGIRDLTLILHQAGYYIASAPIAESVVSAKILSHIDSEVTAPWLDNLISGTAVVSIALHPVSDNARQIIPNGSLADAVIGLDGEQLLLFVTEAKPEVAANLGSQPLACCNLANSKRIELATGPAAVLLYQAAIEEWKLLIAAQLSGICDHALKYAADYSNERTAFGVKIGTFQGLSHPLADCLTANEGARLLIEYAIWKLEKHDSDAAAHIAMAYWAATEAATQTMPQCVHLFGGYGVSSEHDIQLFARRGIALSSLYGDRLQELAEIAQRYWLGKSVGLPNAGENGIDFSLGDAAEALRKRAAEFFEQHLTAEYDHLRGHSWDTYHPVIYKALAEANLLFPEWPKEFGGMESSPAERLALTQTFYQYRWTQYPQGTSRIVGDMIRKFGSEQVKQEILPQIINGEAICCLGLTEPHCGSDVFAANTRAVKQGDKWIINGQKMFTSGAHLGKYVMLLTNTNPEAPKHVGKTLFIVPLDHKGIEVHRVDTVSDDRTNITYYTDVEIDDRYRLGEVDSGSKVMGYMLTLEQGGNPAGYEFRFMVDQAAQWALNNKRNGKRVIDDPLAQIRLATALTQWTIGEAMLLRIVALNHKEQKVRHYGSMLKAFVTEAWKKSGTELINMAAPDSLIIDNEGLQYIEAGWRSSLAAAIYAGTTQVHRSVVAEHGLGMPRSR